MNNAVVYLRGDEESTYNQYLYCKKYADENGLTITNIYNDRKSSGCNPNRKQLNKMLGRNDLNVILVYDISRLTRNPETYYKIMNKINSMNVELIIVTQQDLGDKKLIESVLKLLSNFQVDFRDMLAESRRKAKINQVKKGQMSGGTVPIGYFKDENQNIHIIENEAKVIKEIFEMYSNGYGLYKIREYLIKLGFKTRRNNDFSISAISKILNNSLYAGIYVFNKYKNDHTEGVRKKVLNPESEWIIKKDIFPPIIDEELFNKVQSKFKQNGGLNYGK